MLVSLRAVGYRPAMPGPRPESDPKTDFGYREVPEAEKASLVGAVFDSVANRYDLMNDLMSGGVHRLWKQALLDTLRPRPGTTLVDVAGGTGDIAFRFLEKVKRDGRAIVCDINESMLDVGRDRALDRGLLDGIEWLTGDAEALPIPDMSADACTIAFGLRNVTRKDRALAEMHRILKPGGRFVCLEFSHFALPLLGELYDRFSFAVVPWLGERVTGDREAYEYLVESIRRFPDQQTLTGMVAAAGFEQVNHRNLSGGIAAIHSGWRI